MAAPIAVAPNPSAPNGGNRARSESTAPSPAPVPAHDNLAGELQPASPLRRVGSGLIDLASVAMVVIVAVEVSAGTVLGPVVAPTATNGGPEPGPRRGSWPIELAVGDQTVLVGPWAASTLLVTALAAMAVIRVVVPLLDQGRTPGMALFRLRIVGVGPHPPAARALVVRTAAAIVDLMPVVVPGLVGFAFAAGSTRGQRLGDRLAGTTVVVEPTSTGGRRRARQLNPRPRRPDLGSNTIVRPSPGVAGISAGPTAWTLGGPPSMTDQPNDRSQGLMSIPEVLDRPPVPERPLFNPYPKPERPGGSGSAGRQHHERRRPLDFAAATAGDVEVEVTHADEGPVPGPDDPTRDPVWNEEWQAWVYWDENRHQWLRFDSDLGRWESMD